MSGLFVDIIFAEKFCLWKKVSKPKAQVNYKSAKLPNEQFIYLLFIDWIFAKQFS